MSDLKDYYYLAQSFIDTYADRNTQFANIDRMITLDWDLPSGMPEWVLKVVSTDPRDMITTVVRTFATVTPRFKVMPMLPNEANRNRANEIETAIAYNFKQAGLRKNSTIEWAVMRSAAKYSMVAAQVVYLPFQEKVLKAMGKETGRLKAMKRFGDFAYIIHNPANIYPEWSEYGLEGVMTVRVQTVDEFMDTWGELAKNVVSTEDYNDGKVSYVTSYDYINYEKRCVWGVLSETDTVRVEGEGVKIMEEDNKLGFIPFAIKQWGDDMSASSDEQVEPLLQSVYKSGQWDMLNVLDSMDASLTVKRAAQPNYAGMFPPGQDPDIDNTEPTGVLKLPPGTQQFTPLQPQSADQRLMMEKNQFENRIWQSGVARVLNTLDFASGTAAAQSNQILSQAANSISHCKKLAENALGEIAHQMLCYVHYYGKEYGAVDLYGQRDSKSRMGEEVRISSDTIDPDAIQIEVKLTADLPVDRLQQINGAVLLKQNFKVPDDELLEDIVGGDPADLRKRRDMQDYKDAYIANDLRKIQMETDMEFQQKQMEMQMGMQQQVQSQQMEQEMAMREQEAAQAAAAEGAAPAQQNAGGLGNNPAAGGQAPQPNMGV